MKKKLTAFILTLTIALSLNVSAFAADTLKLNKDSLALKPGETTVLSVSTGENVNWTSSNPNVAQVNGGIVTASSLGRTTITATATDGRQSTCTVNTVHKGIDVSYFQGNISWADVKNSGIDFAIIRTGYGNENPEVQTDKNFASNYDGAKANGIKVGAYHVSYALTPQQAEQEAQMCLNILNNRKLDYPVFIDIEQPSQRELPKEQAAAVASYFCNHIRKAGYRAGIYSNTNYFNGNFSTPQLDCYDKWVAHWDVNKPNYNGSYKMWQYKCGSVPGINGTVDLDYSYQEYPNNSELKDCRLISDTGDTLNLSVGKTYQFKFTPNGITDMPFFTTGNKSVIQSLYQKQQGADFYYKIKAVGKGCTSAYSTQKNEKPIRRCVITVN